MIDEISAEDGCIDVAARGQGVQRLHQSSDVLMGMQEAGKQIWSVAGHDLREGVPHGCDMKITGERDSQPVIQCAVAGDASAANDAAPSHEIEDADAPRWRRGEGPPCTEGDPPACGTGGFSDLKDGCRMAAGP